LPGWMAVRQKLGLVSQEVAGVYVLAMDVAMDVAIAISP